MGAWGSTHHALSQPVMPSHALTLHMPAPACRHWAVVAADLSELPLEVAAGGCVGCSRHGFPTSLAAASPSGSQEEAVPVLALGTDALGWVELAACRAYSVSAGTSALTSAWSSAGGCSSFSPAAPLAGEELQALQACVRGLKLAAEVTTAGFGGMGSVGSETTRAMVQTAGVACVARRLLELEGQLPAAAVCGGGFHFWHSWRRAVVAAETPQHLAAQVLLLAHQPSAGVLRSGAAEQLWPELQQLLGVGVVGVGQAGADQQVNAPQVNGPSCLSIDQAVSVLSNAIDWSRVLQLWPGGAVVAAAAAEAEAEQQDLQEQQQPAQQQQQQAAPEEGLRRSTRPGRPTTPGAPDMPQYQVQDPVPDLPPRASRRPSQHTGRGSSPVPADLPHLAIKQQQHQQLQHQQHQQHQRSRLKEGSPAPRGDQHSSDQQQGEREHMPPPAARAMDTEMTQSPHSQPATVPTPRFEGFVLPSNSTEDDQNGVMPMEADHPPLWPQQPAGAAGQGPQDDGGEGKVAGGAARGCSDSSSGGPLHGAAEALLSAPSLAELSSLSDLAVQALPAAQAQQ
jgi:hypothetical protein